MKFCKKLDVKSPVRGTPEAAGIDFFVPENTIEFREMFKEKNSTIQIDDTGITLRPHERVNIPSGIKMDVPVGYALIAFNKSGVSLKYGLDIGASVVDSDYQGIIHLSLVNASNVDVHIEYGQKIIQFVLLPVNFDLPEEVLTEQEVFDRTTIRGIGGFGSTNTK